MSGRVTFQGTLDRETQPILYLTVTAVEVNTDDETVQTSLTGYSRVQVALGDINDNEPIFFNYVGLSGTQDNPYRAVVSEAVALGHIVVNDAEAFDPDEVRSRFGSATHVGIKEFCTHPAVSINCLLHVVCAY